MEVRRRYYACRSCGEKQIPWDVWAGAKRDHLSPRARRMAVLAGSSWSFDAAAARLQELCGIRLSDETIRQATEAAGEDAQRWLCESSTPADDLRAATGHAEFYTDGTAVNTREGWREMRLSVWAKRPAGAPADPAEWASRSLPDPTARWICGEIVASEELGPRWARMARRAGLPEGLGVSVLADGAKWIWKQAATHLPRSECVVDVFHVSEHLHACARSLYGESSDASGQWAEDRLGTLLRFGPVALRQELQRQRTAAQTEVHREALDRLGGYVTPNIDGMWYRDRLQRGLPIGSGMVEGACKTVVGKRLKCSGARWTVRNADRLTALCCLHYSDHWNTFWDEQAA